jgi:hypothetical protein
MATSFRPNAPATTDECALVARPRTLQVGVTQAASGGTKAMFSQGLSGVLVVSILSATSISTSIAQNDDSDFIKKRNSYPLWNGSLKRDIQGFKPGMTESEAKQRLSDCEVSGHRILCPVASKEERFELSLTEHTRPRLVKEVTYIFSAGGATLETMAKNVMMQFAVGNSRQCLPLPRDKPMFSMAVGRRIIHAIRGRRLSEKYASVSVNAEMDYQPGRAGI